MAADSDPSTEHLMSLIRDILDGKDLSTMTLKIVRESVLKKMEQPPSDVPKFKANVKLALSTVLEESKTPAPGDSSKEAATQDAQENAQKVNKESESHDSKPTTNENEPDDATSARKRKIDAGPIPGTEVKRPKVENGDATNGKKAEKTASSKGRLIKASDDEYEDGDDFAADQDILVSEDEEKAKARKPKKSQKRSRTKGSKSERTKTSSTVSREYEKLNSVVREIGLRMPTAKLKGLKTPEEKCEAVREFLKSKGVDDPVPYALNRRELAKHRRRLETERDLIDIDVSNIIDEGRRTRRRSSTTPIQTNVELPSDFSGAEEEEDDDDEKDAGVDFAGLSDDSE